MSVISAGSPIIVLAQSAVAVPTPADTNEDILVTVTIPAGAMGPNGRLRVSTLWSFTNSGNAKNPRIRLGGIGGTIYMNPAVTAAMALYQEVMLANRGAANSQIGFASASTAAGGWGFSTGSANVTSSIDTSASTTLVITGQKATAGEVLTLESYLVEMIPG